MGETKDVCGSDPTQFAALRLDTLPPASLPFPLLLSLALCPAQPSPLTSGGWGRDLLCLPNIAVLPGPCQPNLLPDGSHGAIKRQHCPQTVPLRTTAASRHNILSHPGLPGVPGAPTGSRAAYSTLPSCGTSSSCQVPLAQRRSHPGEDFNA